MSELTHLRNFPIVESRSQLRAKHIRHLDRLVAGASYAGNPLLKKAVWTMKFRRVPDLADDLAMLLLHGARSIDVHGAMLVPVPLHWSRRFWRGFNQAEVLGAIVAAARAIPMHALLRRRRSTGFQSHRNREQRRHALLGAFCTESQVPRRVILVDDIATSGATLDACAQTLKAAGAQWVEGWVVARG